MAYIKAISLLIAIISGFIFPIQEFLDAKNSNEASGTHRQIETSSDFEIKTFDLIETRKDHIEPIGDESQTSSEIITSHRNSDRISHSTDETSFVDQIKTLTETADSLTEEPVFSLNPILTPQAEKIRSLDSSTRSPTGSNAPATDELPDTPFTQDAPSSQIVTVKTLPPVPIILIQYDQRGRYDARTTWQGVEDIDLLARSMLAEENEKLFDTDRFIDFIGAGWVMVNRTRNCEGLFQYASGDLFKALTPYQQFALGGFFGIEGKVLPGNVAYVANPEAYPAWFGGIPREAYWRAYEIAQGILDGSIPDPTFGALFFADAYFDESHQLVYYPDGRTRFSQVYSPCYTIPQIEQLEKPPWPPPSTHCISSHNMPEIQDESKPISNPSGFPQ